MMRSRWSWYLAAFAVVIGGAIAALALMLVAYVYGSERSGSDMEIAAGLGTAIGGTLMLI